MSNTAMTNPFQNRVETAESLFGILPQTMTLEEAREERLNEACEHYSTQTLAAYRTHR